MSLNFSIIGGDARLINLAIMLSKDGNKVCVFGLEKSRMLKNIDNIEYCDNLEDVSKKSNILITSIPFSSNDINIKAPFALDEIKIKDLIHVSKGKTLISGAISSKAFNLINDENIELIDIMKREELAILNTISTAEGTIEIMISKTEKILHKSNVLILGYGRVAKTLAQKLKGLDVYVTCSARRNEVIAWINANGYKFLHINELGEQLSTFDFIINTVPQMILSKNKLQYVKKECFIIDLASKPGGVDVEEVEKLGLQFEWALALPGKVAPITTAQIIKNTIYTVFQEKLL